MAQLLPTDLQRLDICNRILEETVFGQMIAEPSVLPTACGHPKLLPAIAQIARADKSSPSVTQKAIAFCMWLLKESP